MRNVEKICLKASMSVFLACLLVFILAAIFAFLEVSRMKGVKQRTEIDTVMSGNSLMAHYTRELWDNYHLLFLNGKDTDEELSLNDLEETVMTISAENLDLYGNQIGKIETGTWNLFGVHPEQVKIVGYGLATDQDGLAFRKEAIRIMESQLGEKALEELYQLLVEKKENTSLEVEVQETSAEIVLQENPIETADSMKQKGILSLVTQDGDISKKEIDLSKTLAKRSLQTGTLTIEDESAEWREKLLFRQYLEEYFSDYTDENAEDSLEYQLEYLVVGKDSDKENLQGVVNRLLALREIANLQYLKTDVEKQELILAAATALGTATMTPELIPAYKTGIMAAWAYAESVSDVRILLSGEKVSAIKTKAQWHTDLNSLGASQKISQNQGLTYEQYIQTMLWAESDGVLAYRAMDLIELSTGADMNHMIYQLSGTITYEGKSLFPALLSIGNGSLGTYSFEQVFDVSYLQKE